MSEPTVVRLVIPVPAGEVISGNSRTVWQATHRMTLALVARGRAAVLALGRPKFDGPVTRHVTIYYPDASRRRDAENYRPTVKALQDGAVRAGLLVDDDDDHVSDVGLVRGDPTEGLPPSTLRISRLTRAFVFVLEYRARG